MSTSRGRSIARWVLLGAWCALMFVVPSAALIDRGAPRWAAAVAGALSFPLGPGAWQVIAERARRRRTVAVKVAPEETLTATDRFTLRLVAIALVTCAPWFVLAHRRTDRAVWHHATWVADWIRSSSSDDDGASAGGIATDRRLLQYVPADAEGIIWIRGTADLTKLMGGSGAKVADDDDGLIQGVLALKKGELFAVVEARKLDDVKPEDLDQAQARKWFGHELHFTQHRIADDMLVVVTDGWDDAYVARATGRTPAAKALIDRLGPAPADALIIAAAIPRETIADLTLHDATAWLRVDPIAQRLEASATVHTVDASAAAAFAASLSRELAGQKARLPSACHDSAGALLDGIHVTTKGDVVSIDTRVAPEQIMAAVLCGMSAS